MPSTSQTATPRPVSDLRTLLSADHTRLEGVFDRLLVAFRAGDRDEAAHLWNEFDQGLEAHLTLEEEQLLPELAKRQPEEASALLREHAEIRAALSDLGIGVDLHRTNAGAVERFLRSLRAHAEREEGLFYEWANSELAPENQPSRRDRLLAALHRLVGNNQAL